MSNLNDLKTLIRFGQVLSLIDAQLLKHSDPMLDAMGPSILLECTDRRPRTDMAILGRIALGARVCALNATSLPCRRIKCQRQHQYLAVRSITNGIYRCRGEHCALMYRLRGLSPTAILVHLETEPVHGQA
jgi:hypothetical protein